ncbi:MAG: glycosyltransferase family 4 protein [Candidatus Acidiferrales bacterium]
MSLKLVLYSHTWAPSVGGIEIIYSILAEGLANWANIHGGEPIEVTFVTQTPAGVMDDAGLPFRVVRRPGFLRLIRLFRFADVIHLAGPALLPLGLAWILRKPTVLEHHGYQSICPNGLLIFQPDHSICPGHFMARHYSKCVRCNAEKWGRIKSLQNLVLTFPRRWLAKRVTANVAPSEHMGKRASLPRTTLIYHGVPNAAPTVKSFEDLSKRPPCFAFVGRLIEEKGVEVLLRAASKLSQDASDFRLGIVGDGPEKDRLERLAVELGLGDRTQFLGTVCSNIISSVLQDVRAIVMPSTCEDVAPLVAIEQMLQGHLVIASDIGGLGETVNGFGLKFPVGDSGALASCMRQVLDDPNLSRQLGKQAQQNAQTAFAETRMVEEHLILYLTLIENQSN